MKLGFISDIHEDIVSLEKGLNLLYMQRCDQIICLGDITGFSNPYYPFGDTRDANACINLVRENCSMVVPGNHDLFSVGRITEYKAGVQYPDNWFALDIHTRMETMKGKIWFYEKEIPPELTEENIHYLQSLPEWGIVDVEDYKILISHFLFPDVSGSLRKRIDDIYDYRAHFLFMRKNNCKLSFAGHMHKEGFEVINMKGYREFGFKTKKMKKTESFFGLPSLASGRNKNGVTTFDTQSFEIQAIRIK